MGGRGAHSLDNVYLKLHAYRKCTRMRSGFMFTDLSNCYWKTYSPRPSHKYSKKDKIYESAKQIHQWRNTIATFLPPIMNYDRAHISSAISIFAAPCNRRMAYILQSATGTLANFKNFHGHDYFFCSARTGAHEQRVHGKECAEDQHEPKECCRRNFPLLAFYIRRTVAAAGVRQPSTGRHLAGRAARNWTAFWTALQERRMQRCSILTLVKLITLNASGWYSVFGARTECCG